MRDFTAEIRGKKFPNHLNKWGVIGPFFLAVFGNFVLKVRYFGIGSAYNTRYLHILALGNRY